MENICKDIEPIINFKTVSEDLEVEYEIVPLLSKDSKYSEINEEIKNIDEDLAKNQERLDVLNSEIEKVTSHADGWDYTFAALSGIITGLIDVFFVGEWNFANAKAISNKEINEKVIAFAKKDPEYNEFISRKRGENKDSDRLKNAIEFLEKKYPLPGDNAYKYVDNITNNTHHLDDFCHHPTLWGLLCCIWVQFTGSTIYVDKYNNSIEIPITVNEYGNFVGKNPIAKIFSGIINWFFIVAKTIRNRKGHLMSDIAGTKKSKKGGSGLPGPFISTLKELSQLPIFKNTNFGETLRKAFQNGIGNGNKQVDLKAFNSLFQGASSKLDFRTEMAIKHEFKRQAVPIIINEVLVRAFYFIRRFINEVKSVNNIYDINWKNTLPLNNRTIVRMMTIATSTFTAVDLADAAISSAINSGGTPAGFASQFVLRVNFVGIGRCAIACGTDIAMGVKRSNLRNERIAVCCERLYLLNAKTFYKQANMWIAAKDAEEATEEAVDAMNEAIVLFNNAFQDINNDLNKIKGYIPLIEEKNPGLIDDINDILIWG